MRSDSTLQQLKEEGRQRLYPSLTNPNWLVLNKRRRLLESWFSALGAHALQVADIGGRIQPYRALLGERVKRYISIDLQETALVDVVARAEALPLRDNAFDLVLCTQVLEYIDEPQELICEAHRILKPGGHLILTAPSIFPRDSDHDSWRFMPAGLQYLLRNYSTTQIVAEGSSVIGIFRTLAIIFSIYVKPNWLARIARCTLVPLFNLAGVVCDDIFKSKNDQFAVNFGVLAQK